MTRLVCGEEVCGPQKGPFPEQKHILKRGVRCEMGLSRQRPAGERQGWELRVVSTPKEQ